MTHKSAAFLYTRNQILFWLSVLAAFIGFIWLFNDILLPFVLVLVNWAAGHGVQTSMSSYYYTVMRDTFVGSLCAIGIFLVSYDGYDLADRLVTDAAGLCTICIAFFPTTPGNQPTARRVVSYFAWRTSST